MFDVGFLELMVIMVLGLLVLGPERLPKAAQKVGYWLGKARRYVDSMKSQVEAEFDSSEVKRLLHNQEVQIRELREKITESTDYIDTDYHNQFEDKDDPGTSAKLVEEDESIESRPAGPQYDIIDEEVYRADSSAESSSEKVENKQSEQAEAPTDKAQ